MVRRLRVLSVVTLAVAALVRPTQAGEFVSGSGKASAQVIRVGPSVGGLSAAPTLGVALADYTGSVGRGEAQAVNWAALEISLPPEVVNAVPPLRVVSTDEQASLGKSVSLAGVVVQQAWATAAPQGNSAVSVAGLSLPGLLDAAAGRAEAHSGVVEGPARESRAIVEVPALDLAGGLVRLGGLRWEAAQRTGAGGGIQFAGGTFVVGGFHLAGVELLPGELTTALTGTVAGLLDTALAPTGLRIDMPREIVADGVVRITPLTVHYEATEATKSLLAPVLGVVDPLRQSLTIAVTDALASLGGNESLSIDPGAIALASDILVGVLSGSSTFDLEIGGAMAVTEGQSFPGFDLLGAGFGELGGFDTGPAAVASDAGLAGEAGLPAASPVEVAGVTVEQETREGERATEAGSPLAPVADALRRSLASALWAAAIAGLVAVRLASSPSGPLPGTTPATGRRAHACPRRQPIT